MDTSLIHKLPPPPDGKTGWPWTEETDIRVYRTALNTYPKISIVTPSLNQGAYIEETIRSVLLQNYPNLDYHIIDGGSTDETLTIIKKYQPWLTSWVSEPDQGQSDAINKGLAKCTGEIFNWLNSDDYYLPGALEAIGLSFANKPEALAVIGREYLVDNDGNKEIPHGTTIEPELAHTLLALHLDQPPSFFKLLAFQEIGYLSKDLHYTMDAEWWGRFLLRYGQSSIVQIPFVVNCFRLHHTSKTVSLPEKFSLERKILKLDLMRFMSIPMPILRVWARELELPEKHLASLPGRDWGNGPMAISARAYQDALVTYLAVGLSSSGKTADLWQLFRISPLTLLRKRLFFKLLVKAFIQKVG